MIDRSKWYRVAVDSPPVPLENIRAKATGEIRCPRKGEFFLSGSFVVAYQALVDMSTKFPIAEVYETTINRTSVPPTRTPVRRLFAD